jgi:hypothetical protein
MLLFGRLALAVSTRARNLGVPYGVFNSNPHLASHPVGRFL